MTPASMSSTGKRSDSDLDDDEELALRIALERSKVDMGAVSDLPPRRPHRCSMDAGAGPS